MFSHLAINFESDMTTGHNRQMWLVLTCESTVPHFCFWSPAAVSLSSQRWPGDTNCCLTHAWQSVSIIIHPINIFPPIVLVIWTSIYSSFSSLNLPRKKSHCVLNLYLWEKQSKEGNIIFFTAINKIQNNINTLTWYKRVWITTRWGVCEGISDDLSSLTNTIISIWFNLYLIGIIYKIRQTFHVTL